MPEGDSVFRLALRLRTALDGATLALHTHLRLDGTWTVTREGRSVHRRVQPDVRIRLATTGGVTAWGVAIPIVELVETRQEADVVGFLGPDPLRADWDEAEAVRRVTSDPGRSVLEAIRDQRNLAGLGNLWVNELRGPRVVGRASRPCLRCGTLVVGRGEHPGRTSWCPHCQPPS